LYRPRAPLPWYRPCVSGVRLGQGNPEPIPALEPAQTGNGGDPLHIGSLSQEVKLESKKDNKTKYFN
jgi:hypothetical protein